MVGEVISNDSTEPLSFERLKEVCADATALMAFMTEAVDRAFLEACPHLKIVAGALKGFDNIDVTACTDHGVLVTIVPDLLTEPTAELTLGLMIALTRNMRDGDTHMRTGTYAGWRARFYGGTLQGAVVGVIGAGAVGRETLRLLSGFRGTRLYHDVTPLDPTTEKALSARKAALETLQEVPGTLVFYESPKRLGAMLRDAAEVLGPDRKAAVCRELTKKFEEVQRHPLEKLAEIHAGSPPKGEIVVLVDRARSGTVREIDLETELKGALSEMSMRDAVDMVSQAHGLPRRKVYQAALAMGKDDT